jgi:Uma2 family endonuclease
MAEAKPLDGGEPWTVAEFDRWHAGQPERWELVGGVPVMMSPPLRPHTTIKGNIFASLRAKLAGRPCQVYVDGVEVKEQSRKLSAMPDVVVECGQPATSRLPRRWSRPCSSRFSRRRASGTTRVGNGRATV